MSDALSDPVKWDKLSEFIGSVRRDERERCGRMIRAFKPYGDRPPKNTAEANRYAELMGMMRDLAELVEVGV